MVVNPLALMLLVPNELNLWLLDLYPDPPGNEPQSDMLGLARMLVDLPKPDLSPEDM